MAVTSVMLPLGTPAPPFALRDVVSGQVYSLDSFAGKPALLVIFLCSSAFVFPCALTKPKTWPRCSRPPVRRISISFSLTNPGAWSIEGSSMIADRAMVAR